MKSATGGVKRLKKCARNIPPGHIKALKIAQPLMRPTIKFSLQWTSTDLSNCHMHLYRVELINAMGYVLRMWRTDEKMCAKHPPRSPTYFKHIWILTETPDRMRLLWRVQRISQPYVHVIDDEIRSTTQNKRLKRGKPTKKTRETPPGK